MRGNKIKLVLRIFAGVTFCIFIFILIYKKNTREEQWNSPSVKKEIVEGVIITIYPGARTIPGFKYDYEFKNDLYTNSADFPEDLWNLSVDSLHTYKGKKIRVELIESNPKNSRVLLKN